MNSRLIHTLFELAPLAPITMIGAPQRQMFSLPSLDKDNETYIMLSKEIKTWTPTMRAYWGLNDDLEQAEKTAERAVEMVLEETDIDPVPMHKPLHAINPFNHKTLSTSHGVVMVMERGGTTYYNQF